MIPKLIYILIEFNETSVFLLSVSTVVSIGNQNKSPEKIYSII